MQKVNDHRFDYRKFRRSPTKRNFGYGKLLSFASYIVLLWLYGYGHHQTRHVHHVRFCRFVAFLRTEFQILDARHIRQHHLEYYAEVLGTLVALGRMKVSYAQNLLSSVNIVMHGFRKDQAVWVAPAEAVGRRSQVRTVMPGGDWEQVDNAVARLESAGNARAAAIVVLARAFGMRYREAVLGDLNRMRREAAKTGYVTILEGAKGGRRCASRRIPIGPRQQHALDFASSVRPNGSANLLSRDETFRRFLDTTAKTARPVLRENGIRCFHDLRAARLIELYESISGQPAPVRGHRINSERDAQARAEVALQSGHGEHRTSAAYIGGKPVKSYQSSQND